MTLQMDRSTWVLHWSMAESIVSFVKENKNRVVVKSFMETMPKEANQINIAHYYNKIIHFDTKTIEKNIYKNISIKLYDECDQCE